MVHCRVLFAKKKEVLCIQKKNFTTDQVSTAGYSVEMHFRADQLLSCTSIQNADKLFLHAFNV